jgi:hypothetical protein
MLFDEWKKDSSLTVDIARRAKRPQQCKKTMDGNSGGSQNNIRDFWAAAMSIIEQSPTPPGAAERAGIARRMSRVLEMQKHACCFVNVFIIIIIIGIWNRCVFQIIDCIVDTLDT